MKLAVILAVLLVTLLAMPAFAFDWVTNLANGHQYALAGNRNSTWFEVKDIAESSGGYLSTVNDSEEEYWIIDTFGSMYLWIGFTDYETEGVWHWINGESVTYTHWGAGEPNNVNNEDFCGIVMNYQDKWDNHWNDFGDGAGMYGLIERNASVPEPSSLLALGSLVTPLAFLKRRRKG